MKRRLGAALAACFLCLCLAACQSPNRLRMDLKAGHGDHIELLHLNASSDESRERILQFAGVLLDGSPLEKDFSLFAYYPDYSLKISGAGSPELSMDLEAVVDVNGEWVDYYFPGSAPAGMEAGRLYRAAVTAEEFLTLVNRVS